MTPIRTATLFAFALTGLLFATGCKTSKTNSGPTPAATVPQAPVAKAPPTNALPAKFFPIMSYNHIPNDPAVMSKMKECGFTVAGFVYPDALDTVQAAGMKAIVYDNRSANYDWTKVDPAVARTNIASLAAQVGKHPALFGYYLRDEPNSSFFPGLGTVANLIREHSPGAWPYINLFPNYADNSQLGSTSYVHHLEQFIATCNPSIISYDNYSLMDDGSVRPVYWSNLELVRDAVKRHKIEFWNIVLASAHFNYREVTMADFRFQAYTTLAYGGRGLCYFTYFAPQVGNYRLAPIDQFGNQTPNWYFMQNVNLQIQKLAPTFLELTSDDVYHFGQIPEGCKGVPDTSLVKSADGQFVVGDFTHRDGSRYVMVVNKDLAKSRPGSVQFRGSVKGVQLVSPYTGQLTPFEGEQIWLAPGGGVLLKLNQ